MKWFILVVVLLALSSSLHAAELDEVDYSTFDDEDYSPYEAAIALLEQNGGIMDECKVMHQDCLSAARTGGQRIRCFIQLALCVGAKVVGCSKQCVIPFVQCKVAAGQDFPSVFQCCSDFVKCVIGGCRGGGEGPGNISFDVKDYTPYESAIAAFEHNGGILGECKVVHQDCISAARTGRERFRCFMQLGLCVGAKVVGCSKECLMPFIQCKIAAGHAWPAVFQCCSDFIKCAIGGCKKGPETPPPAITMEMADDDYSSYEMAISTLYDDPSVELSAHLKECKETHGQCMALAQDLKAKVKCFLAYGYCIGKEVVGCAAHCLPQLAICEYSAGPSWIQRFMCARKFVVCAKEGCM